MRDWNNDEVELAHKETNVAVDLGDRIVSFRNEAATLTSAKPPHKSSSEGKIFVSWSAGGAGEYYPSVFGLEYRKIEKKEEHMNSQRLAEVVDAVLLYLGNYKVTAVEKLFGDAPAYYKDEWKHRDVFAFWCKLDLRNRRKLVVLALAHDERTRSIDSNAS